MVKSKTPPNNQRHKTKGFKLAGCRAAINKFLAESLEDDSKA